MTYYGACTIGDDMFVATVLAFLYFMCNFVLVILVFVPGVTAVPMERFSMVSQVCISLSLLYLGLFVFVAYSVFKLTTALLYIMPLHYLLPASMVMECPVCFKMKTRKLQTFKFDCAHSVCRECFNRIIKFRTNESIQCPLCRCAVPSTEIYNVLIL